MAVVINATFVIIFSPLCTLDFAYIKIFALMTRRCLIVSHNYQKVIKCSLLKDTKLQLRLCILCCLDISSEMKILVQFLLATILVFESIETKTNPVDDEPVKTIQEIFEVEEPHVKKSPPTNNQAPVYEHTSYVSYKIQDPNMVLRKNMVPLPPEFEDNELHNRDTMTNSAQKKITDTLQTENLIEKNQTCVQPVESHSDIVMRATVTKELLTFLLGMLTKEDLDVIYSSGSKTGDLIPADIIRKFMKKLLENLTPKDVGSFEPFETKNFISYRTKHKLKKEKVPLNVLQPLPIQYVVPPPTYVQQPLPVYYPLSPYYVPTLRKGQSKKLSDFYRSGRKNPIGAHPPVGVPDITKLERLHSPDFMDMERKFPAHKFQHHNYYSRSRSPKNTVKAEHVSNVKFDKLYDDDDDFLGGFFDK